MCVSPLKGFAVGFHASGKPDYMIVPRETICVYKNSGRFIPSATPMAGALFDSIDIPCGHCIECRLAKSREWANRIMMEASYHVDNYFITLTYDNGCVPVSRFVDPETGEVLPAFTLVKRDLQGFVKRLRRRLDYHNGIQVRYYGVGEYGDTTHRPHYHIIVFGLSLNDLVQLKTSALGHQYYTSALVQSCWPQGFSMVAACTWESAAYVARYCTKKLSGDYKGFYELFNIEPEFSLMSRKPGIARQYFDDNAAAIYEHDEIQLALNSGGKSVKPPAYFDKLYERMDAEHMAIIRERRERYRQSRDYEQRRNSGLTADERLEARCALLMRRAQALVRPDC